MASFPASLAVGDIAGKYISIADEMLLQCVIMRRGNRSVAERRTRHRKVAGSSPLRSGRKFSSQCSTFCADYYFGIRSTPGYRSSM